MNVVLIILLHIFIYSFPVFLGVFLSKESQISLNYIYLGITFTLTQLFDSVYAIKISEDFLLNAGDVSYSALLFGTMFLVISQPDAKVIRNLIYFLFSLSIFLFFLFIFVNYLLKNQLVFNYLNISNSLLDFSIKSILFSFILVVSEVILQLVILKKILPLFKKKIIIIFSIFLVYLLVLLIDGVLYTVGINIIIPSAHFSLKFSFFAKLIFGFGYGILLFIYLYLSPDILSAFITEQNSFLRYILPEKRKRLKEKLENAEKKISELHGILPICAKCKKIRNDKGYWTKLEQFLAEHKDMTFTHGYCPECAKELMEDID